ncbi:XRE family transcriptional regulator [Desulfuromonas sp. DDH964]|uniref:substrate-binding domain-containing protein n=1 Tax=Desulfuromonas sp. DDH964 TaxID=1823759 RepID=UPI00078D0677|nr:substrate-binding domain-containing protein [Desulfuromonas sp. DDH964]AMV70488.1 XRE family transcriptional regulator [Desulfuromonas sp. DDH964]
MSKENFTLANSIRRQREERGWSQQELADRAGLSRTGISAIEAGRLIPSTAAALTLAAAFGCRVEDLFALAGHGAASWAWSPPAEGCRYWRALIGSRQLLFPVEASPLGTVPHDGVWRDGGCHDQAFADPVRTLVIACCDPAVGLLAAEYARQTGFRMLVLPRASRPALELLAAGLVHAAGLHLGRDGGGEGNRTAARERFGAEFRLLRITDWQTGLVLDPALGVGTISGALAADLRWIGREPGSGARQVLDELCPGRLAPAHLARDHRGVATAIRSGFAQAGVALRLVGEEEGLNFLSVREEAYDLCLAADSLADPRIRALVEVVRSPAYRRLLGELPGYDSHRTGEFAT